MSKKAHSKYLHQVAQPIFIAEACIMYKNQLLMLRRPMSKTKFPGHWAFPGGHIDEGEDPLKAVVREVREEASIFIKAAELSLKVVGIHHHGDTGKVYIVFTFFTKLNTMPRHLSESVEGSVHLVDIKEIELSNQVFPANKCNFAHIISEGAGVLYKNIQWENSKLVKVLSESLEGIK